MRPFSALFLTLCILVSCQRGQEQGKLQGEKHPYDHSTITFGKINEDTAKINSLLRTANSIIKSHPDSAIVMYRNIIALCKNSPFAETEASAYNNLYYAYLIKSDYPSANIIWEALKVSLTKVPSVHYNAERHRLLLGIKYNDRAADYFLAGNYDSASTWYIKAVEVLVPTDTVNYSTLATSYLGMGAIAARLSNFERGLAYFDSVEELALKYHNPSLQANAISSKATLMADEEKYDEAIPVALRGIAIARNIGENNSITPLAGTLAICYIRQENPQQALVYSKMALKNALDRHSVNELISANYVLGYNYVELKQYKIAKDYLLAGLELAEKNNELDNITNAYGQLASAYEGLGMYKEALRYKNKYSGIRDSLLGRESTGRITEIETKYRVAQKDKELAQKDKALLQNKLKIVSQQERQYFWIGSASVCILILLSLLFYKNYKTKLSQLKASLEGEERERRRLARELHDGIVSRLSIIKMNFSALPQQFRGLNDSSDFYDVVNQLEQSISELRTTSHNLLPDFLQRAGLAESVRIYCEKVRKVTTLDLEFQMIGCLPLITDEFQLNIYRIIQEFVNNIVKHADARHALIQFNVRQDFLTITIDDDGNKTPADITKPAGNGIGLQNMNDRIRMLHGTIETERDNGNSIYLEFNLKQFIITNKA